MRHIAVYGVVKGIMYDAMMISDQKYYIYSIILQSF